MDFRLGDTNEQVRDLAERILRSLDGEFSEEDFSEEKAAILQSLSERDKVRLVFVGQYSAGKSSIIKMLTGNADIEIAAAIQTDEATTYQWDGVEITDTPGIDTQLHPEHDARTWQAIQDSDMLVFVITNELMDDTISKRFQELAKAKPGAMILIVNKMSRTAKGNTPEQQKIIRDDLCKVTQPKTPEDYYLCFLDAKDYLDAQEGKKAKFKDRLVQRSGYEAFVKELNTFIEDRKLLGKLVRPLYVCKEQLETVEEKLQANTVDNQDGLSMQQASIADLKQDVRQTIDTKADELYHGLLNAGDDIAREITPGCTEEDLSLAQESAGRTIEELRSRIFEGLQDSLETIAMQHGMTLEEMFHGTVEDSEETTTAVQTVDNALVETSSDVSNLPAKNLSSTVTSVGGEMTKYGLDMATKTTKDIAKELGYNNFITRWWNSDIIAMETASTRSMGRWLAVGGKALSVLGPLAIEYYNHQKEEKVTKSFDENREKFRKEFKQHAEEAKQAFLAIGTRIMDAMNESLEDLQDQQTASVGAQQRQEDAIAQIHAYEQEIEQILQTADA